MISSFRGDTAPRAFKLAICAINRLRFQSGISKLGHHGVANCDRIQSGQRAAISHSISPRLLSQRNNFSGEHRLSYTSAPCEPLNTSPVRVAGSKRHNDCCRRDFCSPVGGGTLRRSTPRTDTGHTRVNVAFNADTITPPNRRTSTGASGRRVRVHRRSAGTFIFGRLDV